MAGFLFDEGLDANVADGLSQAGFETYAVGRGKAPPRGSSDKVNVEWCDKNDVVLLTNDRGKKDKEILEQLDRHPGVSAVFIPNGIAGRELTLLFTKHVARIEERSTGTGRFRGRIGKERGMRSLD